MQRRRGLITVAALMLVVVGVSALEASGTVSGGLATVLAIAGATAVVAWLVATRA